MTQDHSARIAVLTGDIVGSTALGAEGVARAMAALEREADRQAAWHGAPLHFTRHRGDGWQVVLARPALCLRSALGFRAALKAADDGFDSYIGMARGTGQTHKIDDLNARTDAVFIASGRALDAVKNRSHDALGDGQSTPAGVMMATDHPGDFDALAVMLDRKSQDWTQAQAQAISLALPPHADLFYSDIAKGLGKSRQAVTKSLQSAWFDIIDLALASSETGQTDD